MNLDRTTRPLPLLRLLVPLIFAAFIAPSASAQDPAYPITPDQLSIPAGANGASLSGQAADPSPTPDFKLCFYTGFGSSSPIAPSSSSSTGGHAAFSYTVPAATIQQVPPSAFKNGSFSAILYAVPVSASACTGASQAPQQATAAISLEYPALTSLSLTSAPQLNVKLTARLPTSLTLTGSNFLIQSSAASASRSTVSFNSDASVPGTVHVISPTTLVSTIPTAIDPYVNHVNVQVCNTAVYSYCSNLERLNLTLLPIDSGVVTISPSTALPTQKVAVSATFGSSTPSLAGAPGGMVAFHYASTQLASSQLILDPTGTFVAAPAASLQAKSALSAPLIADFNQDGVPDLLTYEAAAPVLHLTLGSAPSGSFAADRAIPLNVPGLTILCAAIGDFNHDGSPDVAVLGRLSSAPANTLYILLNDGSGSFPTIVASSIPVYASSILAADFNHDGFSDIALAGALDGGGTVGLEVLFGDGAGKLTAGPATTGLDTAPSVSFGGFQITAADFNGDGFPDIAILNGANADGSQVSKSISIFANDGKGQFAAPVSVSTDDTAAATFQIAPLAPGQLPAVIVTGTTGISVSLNQSTTTAIAFAAAQSITAIAGLKQAVAGDFNGDGLLDVAVDDGATVHILTGDGQGAFSSSYAGLSIPSAGKTKLLASDLNLDTYADLLTLTGSAANAYSLQSWITAGTATASLPPAYYPVGVHSIQARTQGTFYLECGSVNATLTINPVVTSISIAASVNAPVNYGSPVTLSATIPDATATGKVSFYSGTTLLGAAPLVDSTAAIATFVSSTLPAGTYAVKAVYSGDAIHAEIASPIVQLQILQGQPKLTWPTPNGIVGGTPLSATQLDAAAAGVTGAPLPGTFTYTPAIGTVLAAGFQTLKTVFTPADSNDYTAVTASVSIQVTPFSITGLSSDLALLGDPAKTITLSGTGFLPGAVARMNGTPVTTTFVNPDTLTVTIPASNFLVVQTLEFSIAELAAGAQPLTTSPTPFYVVAPLASVVFSGPTSIAPGSQITLGFKLTNPYPVPLTATFSLGFTPGAGLPVDPNVLFTSGGKNYSVVIPADSTASPQIVIQTGTIAGDLTVTLDLMAGGTDVTPASVKPLNIQAPLAAPQVTSVAASASGNTLSVTVRGFSNTREITLAHFHFTPAPGNSIGTPDVTIDVGPIFAAWYADPASQQYGSGFTYTQVFNLSSDAGVVGEVTVVLSNSVGASPEASAP